MIHDPGHTTLSRRDLLQGGAGLSLGLNWVGPAVAQDSTYPQGRLLARPGGAVVPFAESGIIRLGLDRRDAVVFWPETLPLDVSPPLMVVCHGYSQSGQEMAESMRTEARRTGTVILAPSSRRVTWSLEGGPIGADAAFVDQALRATFARMRPSRIGLLGHSDGGSFALSTGLVNGDLFPQVFAFAPIRFVAPVSVGRPQFWLSVGRRDPGVKLRDVRGIVEQLRGFGYEAELLQHGGGHEINADHRAQVFDIFTA
jgi:Predicted esterase